MKIFPAIDIYQGNAVRLYKGDYSAVTVYSNEPVSVAREFFEQGAKYMHVVDLDGAKSGKNDNLETIKKLAVATDAFVQVGGGIRSMQAVDAYLSSGVDRVILGTAAVTDREFLLRAVDAYGDKIAVGVDIKDGKVAIKGWTEKSAFDAYDFIAELGDIGVKTVVCTDINKDGAMQGTNRALYKTLSKNSDMQIIASGGVSSLDDVKELRSYGIYGAIIGKAYYTKAISLFEAIKVAQ